MAIKKTIQQSELFEAIVTSLSQSPAKVGMRIRSEPVLARHLNVQRWRVREVFNQLEVEGVLIRRKGSGTYIRKVPRRETVVVEKLPLGELVRKHLFYDEDSSPSQTAIPLMPTVTQTCLHLAVWGVNDQTQVNKEVLLRIKKRAVEQGHYLTIHPTSSTPDKPYSVEELKTRFKDNHADGYIVSSFAAENMFEVFGTSHAPVMFIHSSNLLISQEPRVMLDIEDAIARSIRTLAAQGYRRIALVGLNANSSSTASDLAYRSIEYIYEHTLSEIGLDYQQVVFCQNDELETSHAIHELLKSNHSPDALCVADDYVMAGVAKALTDSSVAIGENFGVIYVGNKQVGPELVGPTWSCIEFDLQWYGQLVVDTLLRFIQSADSRVGNLKVLGSWCPSATHLRHLAISDSNK